MMVCTGRFTPANSKCVPRACALGAKTGRQNAPLFLRKNRECAAGSGLRPCAAAQSAVREVLKEHAQPVYAFVDIILHAVPEELYEKADEGIAAEAGDAFQICFLHLTAGGAQADEVVENVVRASENVLLQLVARKRIENVVDRLGMRLAVAEHGFRGGDPVEAFITELHVLVKLHVKPDVQQRIDILIMIIEGVGADLAAPDECRHGDLVKRHLLQHLLEGAHDRFLCIQRHCC